MQISRRAVLASAGAGVMSGAATAAERPTAGNDAFPMFSDAEMARRLAAVRREMAARGLDGLLVYGHTGIGNSVGQVNLQYLARYAAVIETWLVVPPAGEPTMFLAVPYHIPNAKVISSVQDIRWGDSLGAAIARLKELKLERGKIGVAGPGAAGAGLSMFAEQRDRLRAALPDATFENAGGWLEALRLIKSDEELALMRTAGRLTDEAHERVFRMAKPGVTCRTLRRAMDVFAAEQGATYPFGHIGATPMANPAGYYPDFYPTDEPIAPGSLVMTEF